jgi:hypothetical protein
MKTISRRHFVSAMPFLGIGLSSAVRAQASPSATLFQNVRIFDGKGGALSGASNVLVKGNLSMALSGN